MRQVTYILIGLVLGASIGAGAGYYLIYTNLVKPEMNELALRLSEVESSLSTVGDNQAQTVHRLSKVEETIKSIDQLAGRISIIEDSVQELNALSQSISSVEDSLSSIESDLNDIQTQVESMNSEQSTEIDKLRTSMASIQNNITEIATEIDELKVRLDENLAYTLLKKELAEPGGEAVDEITSEVFDTLKSSSSEFTQWIDISGEEEVRDVLWDTIDSLIPTLMWYDHHIDALNTNKYATYVITHFPLTIETGSSSIGEIEIKRVNILVMGIVNTAKEKVSSFTIYSFNL